MLSAFSEHIRKEKLFRAGDIILLAVSGGIDSVVMCELFHATKKKFGIAHCNFQLRGKESNGDEAFVEQLAEHYHVPFHSISFDTVLYASENGLSVQEGARDLRYQWFETVRSQFGYSAIATAHHEDDAVETFFINLIRGTGIAGLHGIPPKNGRVVRPLLFTNKEDITAYAKQQKLSFREDSSNASEKYLRNKLRNKLIPELKTMNPKITEAVAGSIRHLRGVEQIFSREIESKRAEIVLPKGAAFHISIPALQQLEPLPLYLFEFLKPYGFNSTIVNEIAGSLTKLSGKEFHSPAYRLIRDRKALIITAHKKEEAAQTHYFVKRTQRTLTLPGLRILLKQSAAGTEFSHSVKNAAFDLDKLDFPLKVRKWQKGDSFQPFGMKGKKKLSDFFIDRKLSIAEKENTWLLLSGEQICWVIGQRIDERFKVSAKTKKIYFAELTE